MSQVTIKIPRKTYLTVKAMAKDRGCFIGKIISDAVNLLNDAHKPEQTKADSQVAA